MGFRARLAQNRSVRNRLREIRDSKGLTLREVAERAKTSEQQLGRLEKGQRRLSDYWIARLAPALEVAPDEIWSDSRDTIPSVPIVGYVGAGAQVYNFDDQTNLDYVEVMPGAEETYALAVRGDSMFPRYLPGDLIFYTPVDFVDEARVIGRECVVQIAGDGALSPTYVKRVQRGSKPGLYRLASYNAPDIEDVRIAWAAPVAWIKRGDV